MIIKSLLDIDIYKFYMNYFTWTYFPDVEVTYSFKNRTKESWVQESLLVLKNEIKKEIECVQQLKFNESEIEYLKTLNLFPEHYLNFLKNLKLPDVVVFERNGELNIQTTGKWSEAIFWETIILSIVNELHSLFYCLCENDSEFGMEEFFASALGMGEIDLMGVSLTKHYEEGKNNLFKKIKLLKENPNIKVSDFGTRRRFGFDWQKIVLETLKKEVPNQLLGTSNVLLAKELNLKPIGTFAHELLMIGSRLFGDKNKDILESHNEMLEAWYKLYGIDFSIALTDTFGTKFFFNDFTKEQAENWKGLRHDSGCPHEFAKKALSFYKKHNIDSKFKTIVFSDGLDIEKIMSLQNEFGEEINLNFGWGTNLTNDLGIPPISIVMKATKANGYDLVKLSDNINKASGKHEEVEKFKKIFNYTNVDFEKTIY